MGDDGQMAFALGPFQQDLVAVAGAAGNPGKDIAFHPGHHRAWAQDLLRHAVFAHQLAHHPSTGLLR